MLRQGLAVLGEDKKIKEMVLDDFPYAEDGQLVWNALVDYFTEYLSLYYSDSGADGKPVVTSLFPHAMVVAPLHDFRGSPRDGMPGREGRCIRSCLPSLYGHAKAARPCRSQPTMS